VRTPSTPARRPAPAARTTLRRRAALPLALAGLTMLGPFTIDTPFPGFAALQHDFGVGPTATQQLVSVYLLAFAVMSLVHGPLSDALASVGCALAPSMGTLLVRGRRRPAAHESGDDDLRAGPGRGADRGRPAAGHGLVAGDLLVPRRARGRTGRGRAAGATRDAPGRATYAAEAAADARRPRGGGQVAVLEPPRPGRLVRVRRLLRPRRRGGDRRRRPARAGDGPVLGAVRATHRRTQPGFLAERTSGRADGTSTPGQPRAGGRPRRGGGQRGAGVGSDDLGPARCRPRPVRAGPGGGSRVPHPPAGPVGAVRERARPWRRRPWPASSWCSSEPGSGPGIWLWSTGGWISRPACRPRSRGRRPGRHAAEVPAASPWTSTRRPSACAAAAPCPAAACRAAACASSLR